MGFPDPDALCTGSARQDPLGGKTLLSCQAGVGDMLTKLQLSFSSQLE